MDVRTGRQGAVVFEGAQIMEMMGCKDRREGRADLFGDLGEERAGETVFRRRADITRVINFAPDGRARAVAPQCLQRLGREKIFHHHELRLGTFPFLEQDRCRVGGVDRWPRKPASFFDTKHRRNVRRVCGRLAAGQIVALLAIVFQLVRRVALRPVGCTAPAIDKLRTLHEMRETLRDASCFREYRAQTEVRLGEIGLRRDGPAIRTRWPFHNRRRPSAHCPD